MNPRHQTRASTKKSYLESQPGANLVRENLRDNAVIVGEDFHRQLWLDPTLVDQIIECVGEREPETA